MAFVDKPVTLPSRRLRYLLTGLAFIFAVVALPAWALASTPLMPDAATQPPQGSWTTYGILSNTGVTNTGPSLVQGDLGSSGNSSATAVTGFQPSGLGVVTGKIVLGGAAITAQTDATAAVNALESQITTCTTLNGDLGGRILVPGVYCFSAGLTGTLTLNAGADPNAVFIFLTSNNLVVNPNAAVVLIGSSSCNVYWRTNALASLDTNVSFIGTIFASSQVTMKSGTKLIGRAIAQTANVTLINDSITSGCVAGSTATATATATVTPPAATQTAISQATQTAVIRATQTAVAATSPTATPVVSHPPPSCVGNIRGSKQDGAGHGLAGWTIQLLQGNQVVQTAVTDGAGNFNFLGLGIGTYTLQEVAQTGWVAQGPATFTASISGCDQNLTGFTFVNVSGTGVLTPAVTAISATLTATAKGTTTATPASGGAGSTPTAVRTPAFPSNLPRSGESTPWTALVALSLCGILLAAGLLTRRAQR